MNLVLATTNVHKSEEIAAILRLVGMERITLKTLRDYPNVPLVEESGRTFAENARLKALSLSRGVKECVLADDSGIVVDALGGAPGIFSARYAGEQATDDERIEKLLAELRGVPDERRTARFVCAMALAQNGRLLAETEGVCEGKVAFFPRGENGFGYDPIFYLPEYQLTMAEVDPAVKNRISHRAQALRAMQETLFQIEKNSV